MNIAEHPEIGKAFRRLESLLSHTDSFVLTFVLYRDAKEQRENAAKLKALIDLPVTEIALKGDNLNPVRTFLDLPKEPRQAIFYTFLGSSLPEGKSDFDKFAGYVNIQREAFTDAPHAVVLWLREEQLVRLMKRAPDFWAWRSGVFDVRGKLEEDTFIYRTLKEIDTSEREGLEENIALYQEILKGQLERNEPDWGYVSRTRLRLIDALYKLRLFEEILKETARINSVELESDVVHSAFLNAKAIAYEGMGDYKSAHSLLEIAMKIGREKLGDEHIEFAVTVGNLAHLLENMKRFDEAEPLYRKVIEISEKASNRDDRSYAIRLDNLANLLEKTQRYDEAERLYKKALELNKKTYGVQHPKYASNLSNMGNLFRSTRRYEEAESAYRQALWVFEQMLSNEHPEYATSLVNLAGLFKSLGRYGEADPLYQKALTIFRNGLGEDHPSTRVVEENYALFRKEREEQKASTS